MRVSGIPRILFAGKIDLGSLIDGSSGRARDDTRGEGFSLVAT